MDIRQVWTNMTNSSRSSVYVNGCIDFLLAINVQSEIFGKKITRSYINMTFCIAISWKLQQDKNTK